MDTPIMSVSQSLDLRIEMQESAKW
jgi:hypothetical protein